METPRSFITRLRTRVRYNDNDDNFCVYFLFFRLNDPVNYTNSVLQVSTTTVSNGKISRTKYVRTESVTVFKRFVVYMDRYRGVGNTRRKRSKTKSRKGSIGGRGMQAVDWPLCSMLSFSENLKRFNSEISKIGKRSNLKFLK